MNKWFKFLSSRLPKRKCEPAPLDIVKAEGKAHTPWWGTFHLEAGQARFWKVGDVILCLDRLTNEWHIASCQANLFENNNKKIKEAFFFKTFTFHTEPEVTLKPILADKSLASRLQRPVYIPAGEQVLLYVSTPVWIEVKTQKPKVKLDEIPTVLLSETWFSQNTLEGELCYAGKTYCSTNLSDLPQGSDRIISPMLIKNKAKTVLALGSISVPLPFLSVYKDKLNHLWTEQLNLKREKTEHPLVSVTKGPPKGSSKLQLLSKPRKKLSTGSGIKLLFHSLMGN